MAQDNLMGMNVHDKKSQWKKIQDSISSNFYCFYFVRSTSTLVLDM